MWCHPGKASLILSSSNIYGRSLMKIKKNKGPDCSLRRPQVLLVEMKWYSALTYDLIVLLFVSWPWSSYRLISVLCCQNHNDPYISTSYLFFTGFFGQALIWKAHDYCCHGENILAESKTTATKKSSGGTFVKLEVPDSLFVSK